MKKKLAVVLCSTTNQMFAVGNVLIGLKKHFSMPEEDYDIVLYLGGKIDRKDENAIKSISNNIIIENYKSPLSKSFRNSNAGLHWSVMASARFECFTLLHKYSKVLYLDTDVLIKKDIIELLDIDKDISASFEHLNIKSNIENKLHTERFDSNKYNLDIKVFNSGVLLFNDSINSNFEDIKNWCYKMTEKWLIADQPLLNLAVQEFNMEVYDFSNKYNMYFFTSAENIERASILHTAWTTKFWNGANYDEWNENNKRWIELGGLPYDDNYVQNKMKEINKIAWFIPTMKLRNIYRVRQAEKYGFRWMF